MKKYLLLLNLIVTTVLNAQTVEWLKHQGGTGDDKIIGLATNAAGNSYVTSFFTNSITIGSQTFSSANGDVLLSKYGSTGLAEWSVQLKSMTIRQVVTSGLFVYIAGEFKGTGRIGTATLTGDADGDAFFAKLDESGNIVFTKTGGGNGYDCFSGIAVDQYENTYLSGKFDSTATFNDTTLIGNGQGNFFIIKYDGAGDILWYHVPAKNGNFSLSPQKIVTNPVGDIICVLGHADSEGPDTVMFGSLEYIPNEPGSNFIVHYDGSGIPQHIRETSFGIKVSEKDIALDNAGGIYLITDYNDFPYRVTKFDIDLNTIWQLTDGGEQVTAGDIKITPTGEVYVAGSFYGQGEFKVDTIVAGPVSNGFIAKYNSSGARFWVKSIKGSDNAIMEMGLDAFKNIYAAGFFTGTISFDSLSVSSNGAEDGFITKLNASASAVDKFQKNAFQLYPNPASEIMQLILPGNDPKTISIRNSLGQLILSNTTTENVWMIPVKEFRGGIYFIEIRNGLNVFNKKLVIKN